MDGPSSGATLPRALVGRPYGSYLAAVCFPPDYSRAAENPTRRVLVLSPPQGTLTGMDKLPQDPHSAPVKTRGYWLKPHFFRDRTGDGGGSLELGPLQVNWYGEGFRVYLTWPGRTRTLVDAWR